MELRGALHTAISEQQSFAAGKPAHPSSTSLLGRLSLSGKR
jgi:hypothetical protein